MSTIHEVATPPQTTTSAPHPLAYHALALLRVLVGLTFLWAFFDKLFGLGYSTPSGKSWISGGSPTYGFLTGSQGPFASTYHGIAGAAWANVAFMAALLLIGAAYTLGITNRLATIGGVALYLMMWSVYLPPTTNPVIDDHILMASALLVLGAFHAGEHFGLGNRWNETHLVKSFPILK